MNVDELTGPELDAQIAEKLMGLHVEWRKGQPLWVGKDLPGSPYVLEDGLFGHSIRPYSTDIAAAWEVFEKMQRLGWGPEIWGRSAATMGVRVRIYVSKIFLFLEEESQSLPLALCRSALKAVSQEAHLTANGR